MMRLYKNIKRLRKEAGLTQAQLSELTGFSQSAIARIERGQFDIPHSSILKFAEAFGVYPGDLMGWDEPDVDELTPEEKAIIFRFRQLNQTGRKTARDRLDDLLLIEKYKQSEI